MKGHFQDQKENVFKCEQIVVDKIYDYRKTDIIENQNFVKGDEEQQQAPPQQPFKVQDQHVKDIEKTKLLEKKKTKKKLF